MLARTSPAFVQNPTTPLRDRFIALYGSVPNADPLPPRDTGAQVTLHTGRGTDDTDLYWGSEPPVWNNAGDTIIVQDDSGETILEEED